MSPYQPRTPERLIEILRSEGDFARSWRREAAEQIQLGVDARADALRIHHEKCDLFEENIRLRVALEPFVVMATPSSNPEVKSPLYHVIQKILEGAPFPDDIKAVNEFCNALLGARAALAASNPGGQS